MTNEDNSTTSIVRFGPYAFDPRVDELRRDGEVVKLSPQPARVLALLLSRPGQVVLRDELRDHLWGNDTFVDFERGLNFCILQVRAALADSSDNPRFVQTVPRKGYRFIAQVASAPQHLRPSASASHHTRAATADHADAAFAPSHRGTRLTFPRQRHRPRSPAFDRIRTTERSAAIG